MKKPSSPWQKSSASAPSRSRFCNGLILLNRARQQAAYFPNPGLMPRAVRTRGNILWIAPVLFSLRAEAQTVETVRVISRSIERKVDLPGEFLPYESVPIHAKVAGFVDKVLVDRGSVVKAGQLLATVIAPELTARIAEAESKVKALESQQAEAEARTAAAQSTYDRMKAASATPGVIAGNELIQA